MTTSTDDNGLTLLNERGFACSQEVCPGCGEAIASIGLFAHHDDLEPLRQTDGDDEGAVFSDASVFVRDFDRQELEEHIQDLQEALKGLISHQRLIDIAHTHKG